MAEAKARGTKWDAETHLGLVRRARRMNRTLALAFPHVYCELDFTNPLELAVATILSAQSTDKRVNLTTPALFARYRTAEDYATAERTELEELIRPTGFYQKKAASLTGLGQALVERGEDQHVRAGQAVAELGPRSDGRARLLFQVRQGAHAVDPTPLLGIASN